MNEFEIQYISQNRKDFSTSVSSGGDNTMLIIGAVVAIVIIGGLAMTFLN
jgi:hypothetical protein